MAKADDIQHFDSSIVKVTKDGETVLSSYLAKGEKLAPADGAADVAPLKEGDGTTSVMKEDPTGTSTIEGEPVKVEK